MVHLIDGPDPICPLKHFATRLDARAFAKEQANSQSVTRVAIYEVPAADTRTAIAALRMGEAKFVEFARPASNGR